MELMEIYSNILLGFGLVSYLACTSYSLYMVYTGLLEHNSHFITKFLYYFGLFNLGLWAITFTGMLILKLGRLF